MPTFAAMIVHLIVGDEAAKPLRDAVAGEENLAGEVVVLKDILHVGPLERAPGQRFSALRSAYWTGVTGEETAVPDEDRAVEASNLLNRHPNAVLWFWMAPGPADVCAYHWLLRYLEQHAGRLYLVNIAGLPFLNAEGKVFFPKSFSELTPREIVKARRLARLLPPVELELDGDAWQALVAENAPLRTLEGGKKLASRPAGYYDPALLGACSAQFSKASRVVHAALTKSAVPTGDLWLAHRLKALAAEGALQLRGDTAKSTRDWDVALPAGGTAAAPDPNPAPPSTVAS